LLSGRDGDRTSPRHPSPRLCKAFRNHRRISLTV
jgi:hypothetical protein